MSDCSIIKKCLSLKNLYLCSVLPCLSPREEKGKSYLPPINHRINVCRAAPGQAGSPKVSERVLTLLSSQVINLGDR